MFKEIRAFAPATVANVACGFDIFGFALETPGDEVVARLKDTPGVSLRVHGNNLPLDPTKNTAAIGVIKLLEILRSKQGIEIELFKKMPLRSGLGSSAASSVASIFAVNALLGSPLTTKELIPAAMEAERVACGSAHADNVAPALLGGFVIIRSYDPLDVIQIPLSIDLYCAVLHPKIEIRTEHAREILKSKITLKQLVTQTGNAAGLIAGLLQGDFSLIGRCLVDVVAEPARAALIPGYDAIKFAALEQGALGCSISGSGPSLFALTQDAAKAEQIGQAMADICRQNGVACDLYLSAINQQGPRII